MRNALLISVVFFLGLTQNAFAGIKGNALSTNKQNQAPASPHIQVSPSSLTINQSTSGTRQNSWIDYVPEKTLNKKVVQQNIIHHKGLKVPDKIVSYWKTHQPSITAPLYKTAASIDWSANDSPVKDQNTCGSCWAFCAVALVENLSHQSDLSEQVIVSCAEGDCDGGWYSDAFAYIKTSGIPPEDCYPYRSANGNCANKCSSPAFLVKLASYTPGDGLWGENETVDDIKAVLQNGPMCVSMLVPTDYSFDNYTGGVYHYAGGPISWDENGHAVLLVGYNDEQRCFKVKNSWGTSWGENGYFRISYDDVAGNVKFGSYGCTVSGVYVTNQSNAITIQNTGDAALSVSGITSTKNWLTFTGVSSYPFTVSQSGSQIIVPSVNWDLITASQDAATVTISSNDPLTPAVQIQVTAVKAVKSIQLTAPNGGESWKVSSRQSIKWTSANVSNVKLEYTKDNGTNWITILSSTPASNSSYQWTVPNSVSTQCKVRVSDVSNSAYNDVSDNAFAITSTTPTITVSTTSLNSFGSVTLGSNSTVQNFSVSAANLTANLIITAPSGFQVSVQSTTGFSGSVTLTPNSGTVNSTNIYVRFSPATASTYSASITLTSTGASSQNVNVSGTGTNPVNASIKPVIENPILNAGTDFLIEVKVGDPNAVTDLYGISFRLTCDNTNCSYVNNSAVVEDFLGNSPLFISSMVDSRTVEIAATKTASPGANGSGMIAKAKYTSSANIVSEQTAIFSISNITATNSNGVSINLTPTSLTVTIKAMSTVNVWPGDCNNDLSVNASDILPIGQYYGQTTLNAANPGSLWQSYPRLKWQADNNNPQRIYADANGDGVINSTDILPVGLNYGKVHSAGSVLITAESSQEFDIKHTALANSSLKLVGPSKVKNNTNFTIQVIAGDPSAVTDLYGLSFRLKSSAATCVYVDNSAQEGSFLGTGLLKFFQKVDDQTIDAALTKTAAPGVNGTGVIATFNYKSSIDQVVNFSLSNVVSTDSKGNAIQMDYPQTSVMVDIKKEIEIPKEYSLMQNYPNPFNPGTNIGFSIPKQTHVKLAVYDVIGREVAVLINRNMEAGSYQVPFDMKDFQSGVYVYQLIAESYTLTKKLVLLK